MPGAIHTVTPTSITAARATVPPSVVVPAIADVSNGDNTPIFAYLQERFSHRLDRIAHAGSTPGYGTAYRHCMQEKHFTAICNMLGLDLSGRTFTPVIINEQLSISYEDIVRCTGLNKKTLSTARTWVGKARVARRRLARHLLERDALGGASTLTAEEKEEEDKLRRLSKVLHVMLVESDISDEFLTDETGCPESSAFGMKFETFKSEVADVLVAVSD
jgi:hypothetical protein